MFGRGVLKVCLSRKMALLKRLDNDAQCRLLETQLRGGQVEQGNYIEMADSSTGTYKSLGHNGRLSLNYLDWLFVMLYSR